MPLVDEARLLTPEDVAALREYQGCDRVQGLGVVMSEEKYQRIIATLAMLLECAQTIAEPLAHLQANALEGYHLNGPMAEQHLRQPSFYQEIARTALEKLDATDR